MSAAGLHKWSGIDQSQTAAMHLRIIFRIPVPDAMLLAAVSLHKTNNHTNNLGTLVAERNPLEKSPILGKS